MKIKRANYLSASQSLNIARHNRKMMRQFEKRNNRKNVPESEYLAVMKNPGNVVEFDDLLPPAVAAGLDEKPPRCGVNRLEGDMDHVQRDRLSPRQFHPVGSGGRRVGPPGAGGLFHPLAHRPGQSVNDVLGQHLLAARVRAPTRSGGGGLAGQVAGIVGLKFEDRGPFLEQLLLQGCDMVLIDAARGCLLMDAEGGARAGRVAGEHPESDRTTKGPDAEKTL